MGHDRDGRSYGDAMRQQPGIGILETGTSVSSAVTGGRGSLRELDARRTTELSRLIETGAYFAYLWHSASFLVVDRASNPLTADIKAYLVGRLVDLWDLNPILWDDVHWAATRLVEPGASLIVQPVLHRE